MSRLPPFFCKNLHFSGSAHVMCWNQQLDTHIIWWTWTSVKKNEEHEPVEDAWLSAVLCRLKEQQMFTWTICKGWCCGNIWLDVVWNMWLWDDLHTCLSYHEVPSFKEFCVFMACPFLGRHCKDVSHEAVGFSKLVHTLSRDTVYVKFY